MTSAPPSRLRPFHPTPFGRYTLLLPLSTGGMGEVFLARVEGTTGFEKLCVIKKILPQYAEDNAFVERFIHEARTLVKLSHGSIAQVLDMGVHEGAPFLALEYVDGKDLRRVLGRARERGAPLPLTFSLFVMIRVLDALAYAHRKRDDDDREIALVHRDVSPQNVLVSYEGEVKVIDFGLAKSTLSAARTQPNIILGKFLYMSPEQARQQRVDRRSDLYSVGLCLYELISGRSPFEHFQGGDLVGAVADPKVAPLSEVVPSCPAQMSALVAKALSPDPAHRFQTAEEFRGKLQLLLQEMDASAGPESVSRFMREYFAAEYTSERKLVATLRQWVRQPRTTPKLRPSDVDTAVFELREVTQAGGPPRLQDVGSRETQPGDEAADARHRTDTNPEMQLGEGAGDDAQLLEGETGSESLTTAAVPVVSPASPASGSVLGPPPQRLAVVPGRHGSGPEALSETQPGFHVLEPEGGNTEPRVLMGTLIDPGAEDPDLEQTRSRLVPVAADARRRMAFAAVAAAVVLVLGLTVVLVKSRSPAPASAPAVLAPGVPRTSTGVLPEPVPLRPVERENSDMLAPLNAAPRLPAASPPPRARPPANLED